MRRTAPHRGACRGVRLAPIVALLACAAALAPTPASAQEAEPRRPELPSGADPNDWEAYYQRGVEHFRVAPSRAEAAFYWASRLAPDRAEPLFARYTAFWMRRVNDFPGYLEGRRDAMEKPGVEEIDSIRHLAMLRNPFVHRGLEAVVYDQLGGRWRGDLVAQGYLAYANGDYPRTQELLDRAIRRNDGDWWLHGLRASAFASARQWDSAAVQMEHLLTAARAHDAESPMYRSKAMMEYGLGLLHQVRNDRMASREAMARAVTEDMSFYVAHAALADAATATGDHAGALRAFEQAMELGGRADPVVRYRYGVLLGRHGKRQEALAELAAASAMEPYWAAPLLETARVLDAGRLPGAADAYRRWLARAPRGDVATAPALARIRALEAASAAPAEPSAPPTP